MRREFLSIIIPAYNERNRLPPYFEEWQKFLKIYFDKYEIIVVNDGSTDDTASYLSHLPEFGKTLKLIDQSRTGKGGAVKAGMLKASGDLILFCDADGATAPDQINKLLAYYDKKNNPIIFGSRIYLKGFTTVKRSLKRHYLGRIIATFISLILKIDIYDTQCGFKLFSREVVQKIFPKIKTNNWLFDIEIVLLAEKYNMNIVEVPIDWCDKSGSKRNFFKDPIRVIADVYKIKMKYDR